MAAATGSAAGLTVAAVIAGAGLATGGLSLWESRRFDRRARQMQRTISEHRLFALAQEQGGTLRVIDVARELRMTSKAAEALLDSLVDEVRVAMQVTDEGEIDYLFRELTLGTEPRVRVALSGADGVEEELGEGEVQNEQLVE